VKPVKTRPLVTRSQKIKSFLADIQIPLVVAFGLLGLTFSTLGFRQYYQNLGQPYTWGDCIFQAVQLLSLNSGAVPPDAPVPWMLEVGRFLTPFVTFYAIIKTLAAVFLDQWHLARIRFMNNHRIVCGLGRKGWLLTRQLRRKNQAMVVIERDPNNPYLSEARAIGCKVVIGDAKDPIVLKKAGISRASALVAVCGEDNLNAEVAAQVRKLLTRPSNTPPTCTIHIEDPYLWILLRELEMTTAGNNSVRLEFFNVFENGSYILTERYLKPDKPNPQYSILVVGLGRLGESLVVNSARRWARRFTATGQKLKVLVVDQQAARLVASLQARFPLVREVLDLQPLGMDIQSAEFHSGEFLITPQGNCSISHAFICLEDDTLGLNAGLSLLQRLRGQPVHIIVAQWEDGGFAELMDKATSDTARLTTFGLLNHTCQHHLLDDGTHERLARAIHNVYRRTFILAPGEPLKGSAHVDWEELDEGYRNSNRNQADDIGRKLASLGYRIRPWVELRAMDFSFDEETEVEPLARQEHIRFMEERISQGWRYGPKRDNKQKLNPDLLEWNDPRFTQIAKDKDYSAVRNIPAYLLEAGFQLEKIKRGNTLSGLSV
jgi:hypothetical protein